MRSKSPEVDLDPFPLKRILGYDKQYLMVKIQFSRSGKLRELLYHIYPTPQLGQDVTQGQFLSEV